MDLRQCSETGKNVELDNSLTILHQNIRVLRNKSEELINSFEIDKINPHVLCFTEHHMVEQYLLLSNLVGYTLRSSYSRHIFQRGGVRICIRKDICYNSTDVSHYCEEKDIEICAVQIEVRLVHVITRVYRAPSGNFNHFLRLLDSTLKFLYKPKIEFLTCGDTNVDYLIDNDCKKTTILIVKYL